MWSFIYFFLKTKKEKTANKKRQISKEVLAPLGSVHFPSPNDLSLISPQHRGLRRYVASYSHTHKRTHARVRAHTHTHAGTYAHKHTHTNKVLKASWLCPYSGSLEGGVLELTEARPSLWVVCGSGRWQQPGAGLHSCLTWATRLQAARYLLLAPPGGLGTWVFISLPMSPGCCGGSPHQAAAAAQHTCF